MAVVFLLIFGRFALVFTAFCLYVAVPLVNFSTFLSLFLALLSIVGEFFGWVRGGVITSCRLRFI